MRRFFMVCRLGSFLLGLFILLSLLTGGAKAAQIAAAAVGEAWYQSALTLLSGLSTDTAQSAMSRSVLQAWRYSEGTD